jgi:4-hydroxy-tetrahydrodipicolinate synthase
MKPEFKGMFPAPPTPITDDGRVHEKALRALLEENIAHGMNGFWMAGSIGEGPALSADQRYALARISGETYKGRVA